MEDWWKLIITLNTGLLAITITLLGQFGKNPRWIGVLIFSWVLQLLSVIATTLKLWRLHAGPQGGKGWWWVEWIRKLTYEQATGPNLSFVAYFSFILGLALLLTFGIVNVSRR
jgi:uncharacterized membrane protein YhaH (DUF805 family)